MQSVNFEFLRARRAELADLGGFAEAYVHTDPPSALVKLRVFAEQAVRVLWRAFRLPYDSTLSLHEQLIHGPLTARIAPGSEVLSSFLLQHLRSNGTQFWLSRQVKGATFREVTLGRLRQLPVLVPPIALQQRFDDTVVRVASQRTMLLEASARDNDLFASLQQRAFRGELTALRVRNDSKSAEILATQDGEFA